MRKLIERTRQPNRIKSIAELDPKFRPLWFKIEIGLIASLVFLGLISVVLAATMGWNWLLSLTVIVGHLVVLSLVGVHLGPQGLVFVGYWFPRLSLWGTRLEKWLERDLEWR